MKFAAATLRLGLVLFFALSCSLDARGQTPASNAISCRKFVQGFYDWYVPRQDKESLLLGSKRHLLSRELIHELKEYVESPIQNDDMGLDFDPYLNSQDPSDRFVVEVITRKASSCWAVVRGISDGRKMERVVAEASLQNGRWVFVNFHYGRDKKTGRDVNLLDILRTLKKDRTKSSVTPAHKKKAAAGP